MLHAWIGAEGAAMGVTSDVLRPQEAERKLREGYGKSLDWPAHALARACVTDPDDPPGAAAEMMDMLSVFDERGMGGIRMRIERVLVKPAEFDRVLDSVRAHGSSMAGRTEREIEAASVNAASRRAGMSLDR